MKHPSTMHPLPLRIAACALSLSLAASAAAAGAPRSGGARDAGDRKVRVARLAGEVASACEARETLRALCDDIGPRLSGSEGAGRARAFAMDLMRRYGLSNVHEEEYEFPGWFRGAFAGEVVAPRRFALHALALGNTPSTPPEGIEAAVIDAAHGDPVELDRLGDALEGKWALVIDDVMPGGRWRHRSEIMRDVWKRGAAGMLFQTTEAGQLPVTGTCWHGGPSPVPGIGLSKEDGEWMRRRLARGEEVVVRVAMANDNRKATCANVVGEIAGTSDEFVVLGAHLDSWDLSPGAVDNALGTAIALEAARAIAASKLAPAATIRVVLFTGEESGLYGSAAYVESHRAELGRCRSMTNCDMTGTPSGIRVMGHEEARPWFEELARALPSFDLPSGVSVRPGIHGDQQAFLLAGVPVVVPMSRLEGESGRYYHTVADTYDKAALGPVSGSAAFVSILVMELAWPERRVVEPLDEEGVRALVREYDLESSLDSWIERP